MSARETEHSAEALAALATGSSGPRPGSDPRHCHAGHIALGQNRSQSRRDCLAILRPVVAAQRVPRQHVLFELPTASHVEHRADSLLVVELERRRRSVVLRVDEHLERQDAFVAQAAVAVRAYRPCEIALLDRELGAVVQFVDEERYDSVRLEPRAVLRSTEDRLGDVAGQQPRVVAEAADHARQARDAVLAEAERRLRRVPGEEDSRHCHAFPVRRQRRHAVVRDRRKSVVAQVAERNLEPRRGDDHVGLEDERLGARPLEQVHCDAIAPPFDPLDRSIEDEASGRTARVLVVRRQVPRTERRARETRRIGRPRRDERQLADALREQSLAELERRIALADDHHAPAEEALAPAAERGVVTRELEPRNRRHPRLCRADREHDGAAAVLAVARDEHKAGLVATRGFPATPIANADARAIGERRQTRLHLLPRGTPPSLGHVLGDERAQLGLICEEAVLIARLVSTLPALLGRGLVRPADQVLVERKAPEHAAGRIVGRDDGVVDAEAAERVARLQPARAAADDDDAVLPRWKRSLLGYRHWLAPRTRRASALSMRSITLGCSSRNASSIEPGTTRQRRSVSATTSALGASPINTEISPKKSPRPSCPTRTSATCTVAEPSRMM